jgi:hypothetical protein
MLFVRGIQMKLLVGLTTALGVLLGLYLGYGIAGVGGAVLYGAVIGVGGTVFGSLLGRTARLLRHSWRLVFATAVLVLAAVFMWGVYL